MNICAQNFISLIESKNVKYSKYELEDGIVFVDFPYNGKTAHCIFSGDNGTYLSLYLAYEDVPDEKLADVIFLCNELNAKYKWATFFVNDKKEFVLHDDAILAPATAADETFELLLRILSIADDVKAPLMKAIYA